MINSKMIYRIIGFLLLIETAMLLCCGAVSLFYKENDLQSFLISSAITTGVGILMLAIGKGAEKSLNRRDGYVIVSTAWIAFSLFGMLPYYIGGYIPSITDAFFETMSGFSSTGATIMNNIESMPHGILFWRAMTQWIGGLGIVFFTIAVLPIFGMGGIQVFAAEASGPTHDKGQSDSQRAEVRHVLGERKRIPRLITAYSAGNIGRPCPCSDNSCSFLLVLRHRAGQRTARNRQ